MAEELDDYDRNIIELERTKVRHLRRIADALEAIADGALVPQKHLTGVIDTEQGDKLPIDPWSLRDQDEAARAARYAEGVNRERR